MRYNCTFGENAIPPMSDAWYDDCFDVVGTVGNYTTMPTTWTTYTTKAFSIAGDKVSFSMCWRGNSGSVWIDNVELVPVGDSSVNHGALNTSYNAETGKMTVTAKADAGYKLDNLTLAVQNYNGYCTTLLPLTTVSRPSVREVSYTFSFNKLAENDGYLIINNDGNKLFNASFTEASVTVAGDCTGNGTTDIIDLIRAKKYKADITFDIELVNVDYDNDGVFLANDLTELRKQLLGAR